MATAAQGLAGHRSVGGEHLFCIFNIIIYLFIVPSFFCPIKQSLSQLKSFTFFQILPIPVQENE